MQQQTDPCGGDAVGEAFLGDLVPVVAFVGPNQTVEERVVVRWLDTELGKDTETVCFRRRFNQPCQHEVKEGVVIDYLVETESLPRLGDGIDEDR